jgi:hypothetical protein
VERPVAASLPSALMRVSVSFVPFRFFSFVTREEGDIYAKAMGSA